MKKSLLVLFAVAFAMGTFAQTPHLITETPEGKFHSFTRNTYYVYWDLNWVARLTDGEINVVTNGDSAFIQNPQVLYTMGGETNLSDIVYLDLDAVNETFSNKTVANVRYYSVTGQEIQQPRGLTIEVTTYTDGTRKSVKVLK